MLKRAFYLILSGLVVLLPFQNCGKGYDPEGYSESTTDSSSSSGDQDGQSQDPGNNPPTTPPTTPAPQMPPPVVQVQALKNQWLSMSTSGALSARGKTAVVWTGSKVIVYGGVDINRAANALIYHRDGAAYDPATNTWAPISSVGAPPFKGGTAVWTNGKMLVFGGTSTNAFYNPSTDTWTAMSQVNSPLVNGAETRYEVWTGSKLIVFDNQFRRGGIYDPSTDSWSPTSFVGAPPTSRPFGTAVWTGHQMLIFGGTLSGDYVTTYNDLYSYDPATNIWTKSSNVNAPFVQLHTAVWTGSKMLVFGGVKRMWNQTKSSSTSQYSNEVWAYDPSTDTWTNQGNLGAPSTRISPASIWTGKEMVVYGGSRNMGTYPNIQYNYYNTGGIYDPATNTWRALSTSGAPALGSIDTAIAWTGKEIVVYGGRRYEKNIGETYINSSGLLQ